MEATVRQEAKQIKDLLDEKNQSRDTLASSSAAKPSSRGEFLLLRGHQALDTLTLTLC